MASPEGRPTEREVGSALGRHRDREPFDPVRRIAKSRGQRAKEDENEKEEELPGGQDFCFLLLVPFPFPLAQDGFRGGVGATPRGDGPQPQGVSPGTTS